MPSTTIFAAFQVFRPDLPGSFLAAMLLIVGIFSLQTRSFPVQLFWAASIPAIGMQIRTRKTNAVFFGCYLLAAVGLFFLQIDDPVEAIVFYLTLVFLAISFTTSHIYATNQHQNDVASLEEGKTTLNVDWVCECALFDIYGNVVRD